MLYKTISAAVYGIDASLIQVEVDIAPMKEDPRFTTVGLPDAAIRESRERIRSALKNSGYDIPPSNTRCAGCGQRLGGHAPLPIPHHTISDAGLIGGGMIPRPGEVSLAHNGVLFLDELPEFPRNVLEVMRQLLEDGTVTIARAAMSLSFPARFMLLEAMNPCPCGYFNDRTRECHCTPMIIERYISKISGPLLDRIDIHIDVPAVNYREIRSSVSPESSADIRAREFCTPVRFSSTDSPAGPSAFTRMHRWGLA